VRPCFFKEKIMVNVTNFEALSEKVKEDDNFCVVCLRSREHIPAVNGLCYECGGGEETLN